MIFGQRGGAGEEGSGDDGQGKKKRKGKQPTQ